jgi:hypothetical protein
MMINRQSIGLKGQLILAQGKRSIALGWRMGVKIVRATTFIKEKILFRTSERALCFPETMSDNSLPAAGKRPKGFFCLVHRICADGFSSVSFTQGGVSDRSSRNCALG